MLAVVLAVLSNWANPSAQQAGRPQRASIAITQLDDLAPWDAYLGQLRASGALRVTSVKQDPDVPSQTVERLQQYYGGVRIWGGDIVRLSQRSSAVGIFGAVMPELDLSTTPAFGAAVAADRIRQAASTDLVVAPQLVILALKRGGFALVYTAVLADARFTRVFVDAQTGEELERYSEMHFQSAVGTGRGVLGDTKKISVLQQNGTFVSSDTHRPPTLNTYDMRGDLRRAKAVLIGGALSAGDLARDSDNDWSDAGAVDAHAYIGWTYDYFFKRFGRHGLDDHDGPIGSLVNSVFPQDVLSLSLDDLSTYALNAFWCPVCGPNQAGLMMFGSGLPANLSAGGQSYAPFAGALDIVAHELTHAVTSYTSNLMGANEAGALNESFSDMMGTSAEFFYRDLGVLSQPADYLIGEDVIRAARPGALNGVRSMSNPGQFGDPDHYRTKYVGASDDGGVHVNAAVSSQAFYLAIEGGTNRTSGLSVTGVGSVNREQIEKVFYRGFTVLLPSNATFVAARGATTQAARDLYGANSRVEQAVDQAWTAVGVPDPRSVSTVTLTVPRLSQTSVAFQMTSSGIYDVNLRGNDADIDLDMFLAPDTSACSQWPLPRVCILSSSISPEAVESVRRTVRIGETYRIWVQNLGSRNSSFSLEHYVTP